MSNTGGARKGAGRPKGSVSKRHVEMLAGAVSEGITPVEYMLKVLRDENADDKSKAWAAEKAAPYIHPRPAPLARPIEIDLPDTSTIEGVSAALNKITQAVATGDITTAEAQGLVSIVESQRKAIETGEMLDRIAALEEAVAKKQAA